MAIGSDSLITASVLTFFVITTLFRFWRQKQVSKINDKEDEAAKSDANESAETENDDSKKEEDNEPPKQPPMRLRRSILILAALSILLSIAESIAYGLSLRRFTKIADDNLFADLLFGFTWMVLFMSLSGAVKFDFCHAGSFVVSAIVRVFSVTNRISERKPVGLSSARTVAFILIACQVGLSIASLLVGLASFYLPPLSISDDPETQPLLGKPEEQKTGSSKKENKEDDKARKAIRARPKMEYLKSFKVFVPFMWPNTLRQKSHVVGMFISSALQRVLGIVQPLVLGMVINDLAQAKSVPWKSISLFIVLRALASSIGIPMIESLLWIFLQNQQELAMKRAAYNHILGLSASFHDTKTTSDVYNAMYHARSVITFFHDTVFSILPAVVDLFAGFAVLYTLFGDYMGLLVLATIILFLWMTAKTLAPRADLYRSYEDCWYSETHQMLDSTQNWYTVSEFDRLPHEKDQFKIKGKKTRDVWIGIMWYNQWNSITRYALMTVAFTAASCLAAVQIAHKEQKVGAFVTLTAYWAQLASPLQSLVGQINSASEKLVRAEKLLVLLEKQPDIKDAEDAVPFAFMGGAVEFENVHFTYDGKRQASEGITFRAPPGSRTALVGETGGGKSTILKLLFRFYDPQEGRVLIDGQDLRHLQQSSFRKHIGWVPQDAAPFNTTILDNVRYSDLELDQSQVEDACKDAVLHDKIMTFTKKYQEKVGERGTKLSGGERQRLAIARAILKKPDILLLDEATSSVDSITEGQIQASLEKLGSAKTTFVIAHRLSTILKADQILVIDKGRLVECGQHSDLIKKDGYYKKLWESQLKLQAEIENKERGRSKSPHKKSPVTVLDDTSDGQGESSQQTSESEQDAMNGKTEVKANGSASPTRSRLKADAPAFVPKAESKGQQNGEASNGLNSTDASSSRRQTKSESAVAKD